MIERIIIIIPCKDIKENRKLIVTMFIVLIKNMVA